ncbi:hypothetical protein BJX96DRAFT_171784 [Aspergillus floccosus]
MSALPSSTPPPTGLTLTDRLHRLQELLRRQEQYHSPGTRPRHERETYTGIIQEIQPGDTPVRLQQQLPESELNVKDLQEALDCATNTLDSQERKIQQLSKDLEDYFYKSRMRKKLITQKIGEIEELEGNVHSLNARIEQQQARIQQQRAQIKALEDDSRRRARHAGAQETGRMEQDGRVTTLRVEAEDKKERKKDRSRKSARTTASSQTHGSDASARCQQRRHQEDLRAASSLARRTHRRRR